MKKWLILFLPMMAMAEVQLFDQSNSGLIFSGGIAASGKNQIVIPSVEYLVEGRFSISASYLYTLKDSTFSDTVFTSFLNDSTSIAQPRDIKKTGFSLYSSMELIEPSKITPLSLSLNLGYAQAEDKQRGKLYIPNDSIDQFTNIPIPRIDTVEGDIYSIETRQLTLGLESGYRFFLGASGTVTPLLGYSFHYLFKNRLLGRTLDTDDEILQDISLNVPVGYMFTDFIGIQVVPKVVLRFDTDLEFVPFGEFKAGIVFKLP